MARVNITYSEGVGGEKKSIPMIVRPYEFILTTRGYWENIVADEDKTLKAGEIKTVKIKPVRLREEDVTILCPVCRHALGFVISIGSWGRPRRVEEKRELIFIAFAAIDDGEIKEGDLLGVINVFSTVVSYSRLAGMLLSLRSTIAHLAPKQPERQG